MSTPITLVTSPRFELLHDPSCACLYATWRGRHEPTITRTGYELIGHFTHLTRTTKLLNDSLLDEDGWHELTTWLAHKGFQQLADAGLLTVAWVLPRNLEALRDTQHLLHAMQLPTVDTFWDAEAAYTWLHRW